MGPGPGRVAVIHLDTHVALWLYTKKDHVRIPASLRERLEVEPVAVSPMVRLELSFLREIGRFVDEPGRLLDELAREVGISIDPTPFRDVAQIAERLTFNRDPFDRIVAAQALAADAHLAAKDATLRDNLDIVVWD